MTILAVAIILGIFPGNRNRNGSLFTTLCSSHTTFPLCPVCQLSDCYKASAGLMNENCMKLIQCVFHVNDNKRMNQLVWICVSEVSHWAELKHFAFDLTHLNFGAHLKYFA